MDPLFPYVVHYLTHGGGGGRGQIQFVCLFAWCPCRLIPVGMRMNVCCIDRCLWFAGLCLLISGVCGCSLVQKVPPEDSSRQCILVPAAEEIEECQVVQNVCACSCHS